MPHHPAGDRSPGHVDLYPFWDRLAESGTPFVLHVGGAPLQLDPRWANTGRPPARDWMGGGENVRSKDMAVLHQGPETFLSVMVMDGVFERFPALRGASVELGAGWVPSMLERLDWTVRAWKKVDQYLAELQRTPSETLREQMAFTPFVFEDVGAFIDASADDLYLFSSDYPHVEGGKGSDRPLRAVARRPCAGSPGPLLRRELPEDLPPRPGSLIDHGNPARGRDSDTCGPDTSDTPDDPVAVARRSSG